MNSENKPKEKNTGQETNSFSEPGYQHCQGQLKSVNLPITYSLSLFSEQDQYHTQPRKQIFGLCPTTEPNCAKHNQIVFREWKTDRQQLQSTDLPE